MLLTRREALRISLAVGTLAVVSGCRIVRSSPSELDQASADLRRLLDEIAPDGARHDKLTDIATRSSVLARELLDEHEQFLIEFDEMSHLRETTEDQLNELIVSYRSRRLEQRDQLFRLQDELRTELSAEEWKEVVEVLNRKSEAVKRRTVTKG